MFYYPIAVVNKFNNERGRVWQFYTCAPTFMANRFSTVQIRQTGFVLYNIAVYLYCHLDSICWSWIINGSTQPPFLPRPETFKLKYQRWHKKQAWCPPNYNKNYLPNPNSAKNRWISQQRLLILSKIRTVDKVPHWLITNLGTKIVKTILLSEASTAG